MTHQVDIGEAKVRQEHHWAMMWRPLCCFVQQILNTDDAVLIPQQRRIQCQVQRVFAPVNQRLLDQRTIQIMYNDPFMVEQSLLLERHAPVTLISQSAERISYATQLSLH